MTTLKAVKTRRKLVLLNTYEREELLDDMCTDKLPGEFTPQYP